MTLPLLSLIIWISIFGGLLLLAIRKSASILFIKNIGLLIAIICLALCVPLLQGFDLQTADMQWQEHRLWIPSFQIQYALGVDGFSLPLIILTCFMTVLVVLACYRSVDYHIADYLAAFFFMQGFMCGAFAALDGILFYTFWEAMLVPMFMIIGIWGGKNRIYATIKFFLYTFLGSVLLLVALIYLHMVAKNATGVSETETFSILAFQKLPLTLNAQKWLFLGFLIAFAVKVPMWPVHTWLPDAHVEAPTGGSVILAAILLKMGGYGLLRFILPITPDASKAFANGMIALSLIAIIYIAFVTIVQKDMKKLIAYSSIAHMGFVTLGFFVAFIVAENNAGLSLENATSAGALGLQGGMVQMISHGFISAALFLCVGVLYDRMHSRLIQDYGGVANTMPVFAAFFMLFALANVGLPGTSGFIGEFLVILAAFKAQFWIAAGAATILILGATYTLWMYKRVVLGPALYTSVLQLKDIEGSEKLIFILLALAVLGLGLWPAPLLDLMQASTAHLLDQMFQTKI